MRRILRPRLFLGVVLGAMFLIPSSASADIPTCLEIQAWYPYAYATYGINYFYYQTGQGSGTNLGPSETQRNMDEYLNPNDSPTTWDVPEFLNYETKIAVLSGWDHNPPKVNVGGYAGAYFYGYGTGPGGAPKWLNGFKGCFGL